MKWIINGKLKSSSLSFNEKAFNERKNTYKKPIWQLLPFFNLKEVFSIDKNLIAFLQLMLVKLAYIYYNYAQDVQKLLHKIFKRMLKDVNKHMRFIFQIFLPQDFKFEFFCHFYVFGVQFLQFFYLSFLMICSLSRIFFILESM